MRSKNVVWLIIAFFVAGVRCSTQEPVVSVKSVESVSSEVHEALKTDFGKALAKSLSESSMLREVIKAEALKKFDRDFDILYQLIKETELENGYTVGSLILKNLGNENLLSRIESEIPTLTIFVPELPGDSFSAATWNPADQIPFVAVSSDLTNDVKIIKPDLEEFVLTADLIPGFPVIVIKDNERVVASNNQHAKASGRTFTSRTGNSPSFTFLADCFDGSIPPKPVSARKTSSIDQRLIDAYTMYKTTDGWQRDYIYYNISPSNTSGQFKYDFQEHLTTFSMNGTPSSAYTKIADQSDPQKKASITVYNSGSTPSQSTGWTTGAFEFKVRLLYNSKNGLGEEFVTYFSSEPEDLFELQYTKDSWIGNIMVVWKLSVTSLKTKTLNLPLFNWDLDDYASTIKVEIEEVDLTTTTTVTESRSVKFATNFDLVLEGGVSVLKKIGLKFGNSLENTQTQTTAKSFTEGNDALGSVLINFADNVIIGSSYSGFATSTVYYETREYTTGWFKIGVEPMKVQ